MFRFNLYIWILWLLCTGTFSDEDINGCEHQPCQNGGICESQNGGFRCLCSQRSQNGHLYGGERCTVVLLGCDGNQCENGGICSPLLVDDQHTYTCICLAGFTGPRCQTPTVFSFESRGYMYLETQLPGPEAPLNVTFSFRTGRPVGTLLQRRVDDLLLTVELMNGRIRLCSLRGQGSRTLVQELPMYVSNDRWHTVEASLGGVVSLLKLLCTGRGCARDTSAKVPLLELGSDLPEPGSVRQSLFIGAAGAGWGQDKAADEADPPAAFLGCFLDVYVDSRLVVLATIPADSPTQVNVTAGCSDKDKCEEGPCQNRGQCVSQGWRSYVCECHRPYEGPTCAEEYITARFGSQGLESYAVFSLDDHPREAVTVSMFLRTRQPTGLLFVLANSTSQYLRLWLEEGKVRVQVNNFESLVGQSAVSDGHFHLVTVVLEGETAILFQSAQVQGSVSIRPAQVQFGDLVYVGGLPDQRASASFGGYFKGCIQDLRIHSKRLQFYPIATPVGSYSLEQLVNVAQGCSSDNACVVNPCLNGGVCYSMWDDFTCSCPPNTAGRQCEELKWCELSPCPSTAACRALPHGFECMANITFGSDSGVLSYRGNGRIKQGLVSVLLSLRTRQADATLLHAEKDADYITISLQDSHLLLQLQAGGAEGHPKLTVQSPGPISDGDWHTVELGMESKALQSSTWIMVLDGGRKGTRVSNTSSGNLDFLREGVDIFLGGLGMEAGGNLAGCLGPVEIGGLPLPFHSDTELVLPRPQDEQFVRRASGAPPRRGCWGADVCEPNPCRNQGVCVDLFDLSQCRCPSEWAGPLCGDLADTCASSPCVHGNCTFLSEGYDCVCELGYRGDQCESEMDMCEDNKCDKAATCLRGLQSYACLCPQNTTGQYCEKKIREIPWYIETIPLPELPVSECLGTKWNYRCFNGGNCSTVNTCDCLPGFVGQWCELDVDECRSNPCENGGTCLNYQNNFKCVCSVVHRGEICQIDHNDFYVYVFLCFWQIVIQVLSYFIMHIDELPDIDWEQL